MTGLYVAFLVTGLILFLGSFIFVQQLSGSDIEEIKKLSEGEINVLIESQFRKKEQELSGILNETTERIYDEFDRKTDRETNEKIMELGKYAEEIKGQSEGVLSSINHSHDEVIFMYDRLNDKQEKLTEMTAEMQQMESNLRYLKESVSALLSEMEANNVPVEQQENAVDIPVPKEVLLSMKDELERRMEQGEEGMTRSLPQKDSRNSKIVKMYKEGFSEVEIAREMGIGLGEVKLILGLFR